ncbi:MAG TPA: hypothetical protein PLL45_16150 [Thermoflexales bacterium]|nr:hypothetical protein [Thermoflexales bacterium]
MFAKFRKSIVCSASLAALLLATAVSASPVAASQEQRPAGKWCGRLSSFTSSYYSTVERIWKPILYVWKGQGAGNPTAVSVWYNGNSVPNSDDAVRTSSPQVDPSNGWVGYFIAKRFYFAPSNWAWDDDWRWEVRGCIP